jgi:hypothetical protein
MNTTPEQRAVVESRFLHGYSIEGTTPSLVNGLPAVVLTKGRHTVRINTLGYDEHLPGVPFRITPMPT